MSKYLVLDMILGTHIQPITNQWLAATAPALVAIN
jgi:hypothetical protein